MSDVKARHDKMVELVERMLDPSASSELAMRNSKGQALHKELPADFDTLVRETWI